MTVQQIIKQVDALKLELDALRPIKPEQEQRIMQKLRLEWTYHSNAIEGNTLTFGETKAFLLHGITAQGKPFREYLDIEGHAEAIEYLQEFIRREEILTEAVIRELHKIILVRPYEVDAATQDGRLTKHTVQPGQYKSMPNHVRTSSGNIHYYASPEDTPIFMNELVAWYRGALAKGVLHPLILAATFHYRFVAIHPFDDGNGRMARLLMNLILMQAGYVPTIVQTGTKNEYLLALEKADEDDDLSDFIILLGASLIQSLDLYIRGAKGEAIEESGDLDKKLSILRKKLNAQETAKLENTPAIMAIWHDNFLYPFLSGLFVQLAKFDRFFSVTTIKSIINNAGLSSRHTSEPFLKYIENCIAKGEEVEDITIIFEWGDFVTDKDFHLILSYSIRIQRYSFEIYWFVHVYNSRGFRFSSYDKSDEWDMKQSLSFLQREHAKLLIEGNYGQDFSREKVQALIQIITDEIFKIIDQKATG